MEQILVVIFMLASIGMVALILMQHGKGADAGAAFGSGASATVFGAQGSANFLSRTTAVLAAGWFVLALALAYFAMNRTEEPGLMDRVQQEAPAAETPAPVTDLPDVPGMPKAAPAPDDIPVPPPAPAEADAEEKSETPAQTGVEKSGAVVDTAASETQAVADDVADAAESAVEAAAEASGDTTGKAE
ncbi:MAG: preprotein translocase subunit SecG [Chromatiales bacterium]|jgi:preprotein translocase subunit SecG